MMESSKKGQRKRKSAGVGDIFEVSDKDLSPEPEEIDYEEPETKILKTRNSDVSESRQNFVEPNLKSKQDSTTEIAVLLEKPQEICKNSNILKTDLEKGKDDIISEKNIDRTIDEPLLSAPQLIDEVLEEGEVNDTILDETVLSPGPPNPSISIKFDNKSVADIYRRKFLKFIQSFIELEVQKVDDTMINVSRNAYINPKEWIVLDSGDTPCRLADKEIKTDDELAKELPTTPKSESPKKKKKKKKKKELFVLDTNPGVDNQKSLQTKYSTKFLLNDEEKQEAKEISKPAALSICFNCEKHHSLKDCPEPKHYGKINANRQKFSNKNKTSRYHLEEDQKYSNLQPGKLSPALRKALCLKKYQMPSYIYLMRILGYPPGWLEEAKVVDSELTMFDIDGNNVKNTNLKRIKGLDPERVIDYPGFNIPLDKEFKDEYKFHRVPPYSDDFSKEKMIDYFKNQCLKDEDDFETQDMDLDNTNDLIVIDSIEEPAEIKVTQNKQMYAIIDSDSNNAPSPSLKDLEKAKKSLLEELKTPGQPLPWEYPSEDTSLSSTGEQKDLLKPSENEFNKEDSKKGENNDEPTKPDIEIVTKMDCEAIETTIEVEISESDEPRNTSSPLTVNSSVNTVKHSTFGTPIIKSNTPYNRLPNPDNFSKGVSPVIDFENLPNSTGKYEQMTGVLQKVRNSLKKNQHKTKT